MEKNRVLLVKLYPEISNLTRDNPPIASYNIRVVCSAGDRKALTHPGNWQKHICIRYFFFPRSWRMLTLLLIVYSMF